MARLVHSSSTLPLLFLFIQIFSCVSRAIVPPSDTFKYINEGEFGYYIAEYDANYRALDIYNSPFQLCFYNTTPNAYTLALRLGTRRSESLRRWVWEANRGKPVRDNATLTFGADGNLVLADSDGTLAWHTNTANKGVTGLKLLPNGNLVLHDANGKFVWQSFDYPTDTLLVGQSLRAGVATQLVSRASPGNNVDGAYSLVLEPKNFALYYRSTTSPKPLLYFSPSDWFYTNNGALEYVTFNSEPENEEAYAYDLKFDYQVAKSSSPGNRILARPNYNATLSFLRLGIDGNIKVYTFYDKVDYRAWEVTYSLFDRDNGDVSECQLPERCGKFGLCEDSQCVACPSANGLLGWSKNCEVAKVPSCKGSDFHYYKLEGVDHFISAYTRGDGPMKQNTCERKCATDCKCLGYFYHQDTSRCWIAYDLKTLTKVDNSAHLGYIKAPNK